MNLLLDTHVLLWALGQPEHLDGTAREAIRDARNRVVVSAASAWEIAIKRKLGKLRFEADLGAVLDEVGFDALSIGFEHARVAGELPGVHRDPFDRMLVAQAQIEALTLVTRDAVFARYEVATLPA